MKELFLNDVFARLWRDRDPFVEAEKLDGEVFRAVKNRRTFRFEVDGAGYFAKVHRGIGYRELFKNLLVGKIPSCGAANEYRAIRRCEELDIPTMTPAAYGTRGWNPARLESFLITEELTDCTSLEDYCLPWAVSPPPAAEKYALIDRLAQTVGTMHRDGLNHRDCYLCHFLRENAGTDPLSPQLHVIDLHRAQQRQQVPFHYRVKDVAGLYFSSMETGISRRDLCRFIRAYSLKPLRHELRENRRFWRAVARAAHKVYRKDHGRPPPARLP